MATTMFFEEGLRDAAGSDNTIELELGRSSFVGGESLVYIIVDGKSLILDEEMGRKFCDAAERLSSYLG